MEWRLKYGAIVHKGSSARGLTKKGQELNPDVVTVPGPSGTKVRFPQNSGLKTLTGRRIVLAAYLLGGAALDGSEEAGYPPCFLQAEARNMLLIESRFGGGRGRELAWSR